jgi:ankyrin repeat protein
MMLLENANARPESQDLCGVMPLAVAAEKGHISIAALLLQNRKVHINSEDNRGSKPLSIAIHESHEEVVRPPTQGISSMPC